MLVTSLSESNVLKISIPDLDAFLINNDKTES